jgi:hypothetical protein
MMFVVVTVFGVWLGWELHIVRERKAILAEIRQASPNKHVIIVLEEMELIPKYVDSRGGEVEEYARVPRIRRFLGDSSIVRISFPRTLDPKLIERIENWFPEAELDTENASRDSLYKPEDSRLDNYGNLFTTGYPN